MRIAQQEDDESTGLAALECLKAILVVLASVQETPELYPKLESIVLPQMKALTTHANIEYFEDFSRIVSCFASYSATVSAQVWEFVPHFCEIYATWGMDFLPSELIYWSMKQN